MQLHTLCPVADSPGNSPLFLFICATFCVLLRSGQPQFFICATLRVLLRSGQCGPISKIIFQNSIYLVCTEFLFSWFSSLENRPRVVCCAILWFMALTIVDLSLIGGWHWSHHAHACMAVQWGHLIFISPIRVRACTHCCEYWHQIWRQLGLWESEPLVTLEYTFVTSL